MYDSRNVPWKGLGTQVIEAATSGEAIEKAGLNWTVSSKQIFSADGIEIPNYKANTRDDNNEVLGIVKNRYQIVQNVDAFKFTDSLIGGDTRYETAGSFRNGRQIWLLAKTSKTSILGDEIEPYICFTNTHDGSGAVRVVMTPIRVVCQNTLNMALKTADRAWSAIHTGSIDGRLAEARETLGLTQLYLNTLNDAAINLASKHIDAVQLEKLYNQLFPIDLAEASERQKNANNEMRNKLTDCYNMPDINNFRGTAWGVMMAVTDFADHASAKRNSASFEENRWNKILNGHPLVDKAYALVDAI